MFSGSSFCFHQTRPWRQEQEQWFVTRTTERAQPGDTTPWARRKRLAFWAIWGDIASPPGFPSSSKRSCRIAWTQRTQEADGTASFCCSSWWSPPDRSSLCCSCCCYAYSHNVFRLWDDSRCIPPSKKTTGKIKHRLATTFKFHNVQVFLQWFILLLITTKSSCWGSNLAPRYFASAQGYWIAVETLTSAATLKSVISSCFSTVGKAGVRLSEPWTTRRRRLSRHNTAVTIVLSLSRLHTYTAVQTCRCRKPTRSTALSPTCRENDDTPHFHHYLQFSKRRCPRSWSPKYRQLLPTNMYVLWIQT